MKHGSRSVLNRRPLEYLLIVVALGLFASGVFIYNKTNSDDADTAQSQTTSAPAATPDEVDQLTEQDIASENKANESADQDEETAGQAVDGAADGLGGIYDETNY